VTDAAVDGPFVPDARSRRPYVGILVLAAIFLLPGLALVEYAGRNAYDFDWRLAKDPVKTTARATEFRTLESGPGSKVHTETYELRYSFAIPGDDTTYRATSSSMFDQGDDLWIDVPKDVWDDARDSHEIKVEYLRSDPSISQPVKAHRGSITSIVLGLAGVVMAGIGLLLLWGGLRPLWRGRDPKPAA
jgi:hypothetical protein